MRLILVRLSALGDIVHTWPLADAVRAVCPDGHLTWVVEAPFVPLVEGHPAVDEVVAVRTRAWRRRPLAAATRREVAAVRRTLSEPRPDFCLDPQGLLKSAIIGRWTRARRRVVLARPWRRELLGGLGATAAVAGSTDPHVVATNLALVRALGREPSAETVAPDGSWLLRRAAGHRVQGAWDHAPAVLLPGAGREDKILAVASLAEVARGLVAEGREVVVAWGPGEETRAQAVVGAAGAGVHLAPPTDLLQLTALLGEASLVIGGDTGPVHLAASLGVPTVGVFLTTDAARNGPLGRWTAVVSGARAGERGPTGSAAAIPVRAVEPGEILDTAVGLAAEAMR